MDERRLRIYLAAIPFLSLTYMVMFDKTGWGWMILVMVLIWPFEINDDDDDDHA